MGHLFSEGTSSQNCSIENRRILLYPIEMTTQECLVRILELQNERSYSEHFSQKLRGERTNPLSSMMMGYGLVFMGEDGTV